MSNNGVPLKSWLGGSLRSLKMTPIDRSYTTLYWSADNAVVTIALSCTIFELFGVQNIVTLKSRLGVIGAAFDRSHTSEFLFVFHCNYGRTL